MSMDLIDRKIFADSLCEECIHAFAGNITVAECRKHECVVMNKINEAKPVDAEIVVRCKECRHWRKDVPGCTDKIGYCRIASWMVGDNGHCVYGQPKEIRDDLSLETETSDNEVQDGTD